MYFYHYNQKWESRSMINIACGEWYVIFRLIWVNCLLKITSNRGYIRQLQNLYYFFGSFHLPFFFSHPNPIPISTTAKNNTRIISTTLVCRGDANTKTNDEIITGWKFLKCLLELDLFVVVLVCPVFGNFHSLWCLRPVSNADCLSC